MIGCGVPRRHRLLAGVVFASAVAVWPAHVSAQQVTFNHDIAPIIFEHCSPCHRTGEAAPFSLVTYAEVRSRASQIARATADRLMPPWKPEPGYGAFARSRRL